MLQSSSKYFSKIGEIDILEFLGKGKSGYSYLGKLNNRDVVLKIMHHEVIPYYSFTGNKVEAEIEAYNRLIEISENIPKLMDYNYEENYLIKEFISGEIASKEIAKNRISEKQIFELIELSEKLMKAQLNIDYFPSNFVIQKDKLFYIDYEINKYDENWSFKNWGIYYWLNNRGFRRFLETNDSSYINENINKGIPYKKEFENKINYFFNKFDGMK